MGLGVYISCELKCLRHGGEAKASLNRAIVSGIAPEAEAI